jgi:N-formylglutamate deformylase
MHYPEYENGSLARYYETRESRWMMCPGETAIVAASIHDGHDLSAAVARRLKLDEPTRLREEDPCTYRMTPVADNRIAVSVSRFVVDMNRPREKAVYRVPEDAWGLDLWSEPPTEEMVEHSLALYDAFYEELEVYLRQIEARHGFFVVLDLHSYNHRRKGPDAPPEDPKMNPDINIGTATLLDRRPWEGLIGNFIRDLRRFDYFGQHLDVRENAKFCGGYMAEWIHRNFRDSACVLSVEFKKIFMDEWSGQIDLLKAEKLHTMLKSAMPGLEASLVKMGAKL